MSEIWQRVKQVAPLLPLVAAIFLREVLPKVAQWTSSARLHYEWKQSHNYIAVFIAGISVPYVVRAVIKRLLSFTGIISADDGVDEDNKIYGLKHGLLNLDLSRTEMWMNMGHWGDQSSPKDFPRACRALLEKMLEVAKVGGKTDATDERQFNIIDVGFGCGDQTLVLKDLKGLRSYVGITKDRQQFVFAQQRLQTHDVLVGLPTKGVDVRNPQPIRQVFCADAAKPNSWSAELNSHIAYCCYMTPQDQTQLPINWVLALDVQYHFSPSRLTFFKHAHKGLKASIMAFDLLLPEPSQKSLTLLQSCVLRLVALLTSTPYSNFLTPSRYKAQLIAAGYAEEDIEITDISEHVFDPLVAYMKMQDKRLKVMGLGIGVYHAARLIFGWWARTGVVRGCIVVARRKPETNVEAG